MKGTCRWVSVDERIPQWGYCTVLFPDGMICEQALYRGSGGWGTTRLGCPPTHWLEVIPPDPPKKKVKKEGWVLPKDIGKSLNAIDFQDTARHWGEEHIKVTYEVEE
jgi:hypothetical protein